MQHILCYGDSNTWGLVPGEENRYPWGIRWTSILQERFKDRVHVIEEGLCGRTTIFEDIYRTDRNGLRTLPLILESHSPLDAAILMLGTNDCKSHYNNCAFKIAKGLGQCVDLLLEKIPAEKILILSPIHLGKDVWKEEYDPEFNTKSVEISGQLEKKYQKIAIKKGVHFLAASDYAKASERDNEHMDEKGHAALAEAIFEEISRIGILS